MEHIDEFLMGLSKEELQYIADRAEVLITEQENSKSESGTGELSISDFED